MSTELLTETEQYLTFNLGEEQFAVNVSRVREVVEFASITRIPRTPDYMRGVINLRGSVVPVIDMRLKFDMSKTEKTIDTCVVVMELSAENETLVLGALADSVQEVVEFSPDQIEPAPRISTRHHTEFIEGIGKRNNEFVLILDIDRIFSTEELAAIRETDTEEAEQ